MSKDAPTPPDYVGAAEAQGQSSQQLSEQQTVANRPDINTPFGSQDWTMQTVIDPTTGQKTGEWTQNTTLTPAMQQALTEEQGVTSSQATLANSLLGQEQQQEKTPINFNQFMPIAGTPGDTTTAGSVPNADEFNQNASDAAFNEFMGYNQPLMQQASSQLDTQLRNQGLQPGDAAYDTAMKNLSSQQSQAVQQAQNNAVLTGSQIGQQEAATTLAGQQQEFGQSLQGAQYQDTAASDQIANAMQERGFTLNQINAILSGNQVNLPQTPGFATAGAAQPVQALTAAEEQGQAANADYSVEQQNAAGEEGGAATIAMAIAYAY